MNKKIQELEREYQLMFELYGVQSRMWSMLYENYSNAVFCPENRKDIIQQYLAWEDFTIRAKEYDVAYYMGIDIFLKEYKNAVYQVLSKT